VRMASTAAPVCQRLRARLRQAEAMLLSSIAQQALRKRALDGQPRSCVGVASMSTEGAHLTTDQLWCHPARTQLLAYLQELLLPRELPLVQLQQQYQGKLQNMLPDVMQEMFQQSCIHRPRTPHPLTCLGLPGHPLPRPVRPRL